MRSLFGKIFIWFCMTVVLGLISTFAAAYLLNLPGPGDRRGPFPHFSRAMTNDTVAALQQEDPQALPELFKRFHDGIGITARVYDEAGRELSGLGSTPEFDRAVAEHLAKVPVPGPEERHVAWQIPLPPGGDRPAPRPMPGSMRHGDRLETMWIFTEDGRRYIRLFNYPSALHFLRIFTDGPFIKRLCVFMIAGFFLSYFLARHLSQPVRRLQLAARRLRAGDLSVRVGSGRDLHYSEIRNLAMDFDSMAERLEKLVETQRRLICDISHELRSPLTRLNLSLELARKRSGPEAQGDLDRIAMDSARLEQLIDQVLAFAKMENLPEDSLEETVNLGALLVAVTRDADLEAQAKGVVIKVDVQSTAVLSASQELLRRALENVIRNAIRHTPSGSSIDICLARSDASGEVLLQVRDYGSGAPEEHLDDLFRPFFRADDSRDRNTGGTGLGLAIASRAVRLHGGRIGAANAPGGGLIVDIRLPLTD